MRVRFAGHARRLFFCVGCSSLSSLVMGRVTEVESRSVVYGYDGGRVLLSISGGFYFS